MLFTEVVAVVVVSLIMKIICIFKECWMKTLGRTLSTILMMPQEVQIP